MTTWVEVRREALTANARAVRQLVGPDAELCAVVKANGYGHGTVLSARAFLEGGATRLGVTTVEEAVELRRHGIDAPVLLLASHPPDEVEDVVEHRLTATVSNLDAAKRLADEAALQKAEEPVQVHLLVDCGMGRDGCLPDEAPELYRQLLAVDRIAVEGVFTHFPNSIAQDKSPTKQQLARFLAVVEQLTPRPSIVHAANSGAAVDLPESRLDQVRVGTLLYGQYPSQHVSRLLQLSDTWTLKTRVVEVRRLPKGTKLGYGGEYELPSERLIGTLLIGWQHGFTLLPESLAAGWKGAARALRRHPPVVRIREHDCPVVGRVSMQTCTVDVTEVPNIAVGDIATIPARRVTCDRGIPRLGRVIEA